MLVKQKKTLMEMILRNNKNRILNIVILIPLCVLFVILFVNKIEIPCMFKSIFGFSCPTCGMTRAIKEIFKANLLGALKYNVLSVFIFCFIIISYIFIIYDITKNTRKYIDFMNKVLTKYWYSILIILFVMFFINNIFY